MQYIYNFFLIFFYPTYLYNINKRVSQNPVYAYICYYVFNLQFCGPGLLSKHNLTVMNNLAEVNA